MKAWYFFSFLPKSKNLFFGALLDLSVLEPFFDYLELLYSSMRLADISNSSNFSIESPDMG